VEWQPNDKHLLRVGNPRLYDHPYQSPHVTAQVRKGLAKRQETR